jgi:hypothetical protein
MAKVGILNKAGINLKYINAGMSVNTFVRQRPAGREIDQAVRARR